MTVSDATEAAGDGTSLAQYVQATAGADGPFVDECEARATELVDHHIGGADVPDVITRAAVLEVGADLYNRRRTRNGVTQFTGNADTPPATLRINRDPMTAAYALLRPYVGPGIA